MAAQVAGPRWASIGMVWVRLSWRDVLVLSWMQHEATKSTKDARRDLSGARRKSWRGIGAGAGGGRAGGGGRGRGPGPGAARPSRGGPRGRPGGRGGGWVGGEDAPRRPRRGGG